MLQGVAGGFVEGNRMLKTLMDAMPIGCYVLRPDHTVLYWNPAAEKFLGFSAEEMQEKRCVDMPLGCSFTNSTHIKGAHCPAIVAYATGKAKTLEMFMRRKDGKDILLRNTLVPLADENGEVKELVSFFVPLTDANYDQGLIKAIYETATRDPLTCLPGRKFMEVCLDEAMEIYRRTGQPFAVLFADVNNFHDINNTYGHAVGDDLLRAFGIALRKYGRKADKFCRWGGDEFVGLLHLRHPEDIDGAAKRFCFLSSNFPHFHHRNSPSSSWENPHFQQVLSGSRFHYCILPHEGVFHPVAPAAGHQEMAVVSQPVNHGGCHLFIGKDAAPFRELQVRRQDEALALVAV